MCTEKFVLETELKSVPASLLWSYISTSNGLSRWFADKVEIQGKNYVFSWKGHSQTARVGASRQGVYIRFHWDDADPKEYFELRIAVNALTDDTELIITDFAEGSEVDDARNLWISQVDTLRRVLGC